MSGQRVPAPAVVWPEVAYVVLRDHPEVLRTMVAKSRGLLDPVARRHFTESAALLRQSAGDWVEWSGLGGSAVQAGGGNAEVPLSAGESASGRPPSDGLTTREVATRLNVSDRQVRNLVGGEVLVATRRGRGWVIDEVSVAIEEERRRRARDERTE